MSELGWKAREKRRLEALELERSVEQRSGAAGRFARFNASMRDPRQSEFTRPMILTGPDPSPREAWDFRPFIISLCILAIATTLFTLDDSTVLTLGPTRELLSRGPPAASRLLPAPAVGSEPLPQTGSAGLPSVPAEAMTGEAGLAGMVDRIDSGWSAALHWTLRSHQVTSTSVQTGASEGQREGSSKIDRPGPVYTGAADEKSIFALAEDFSRGLPNPRRSHGKEATRGGSSAWEIDDRSNASSKLDDIDNGNIIEVMAIEIDDPADFGPLVQIATLRHKENVPAVLEKFDRSSGQDFRFYTAAVEIGGNVFYIVYVGPFDSTRAAALLCEEMRAHGGDCSVAAR